MQTKEIWNSEYQHIIDAASTEKLSAQDDPTCWGVTTQDISNYLYVRWSERANAMQEQERLQYGDVCWAILRRNDPREMMPYLSERDLAIIARDRYRPKDPAEDRPLTIEEMRRLVEG